MDKKQYKEEQQRLREQFEQHIIQVATSHPHWSLRDIGKDVGVSYQQVKNVLDKYGIDRKK